MRIVTGAEYAYISFMIHKGLWAILLFVLLPLYHFGQDGPKPAEQLLSEAYRIANRENKKVFIIFHASWCSWCRKMDSSIHDPVCWNFFNRSYTFLHLTVYETPSKKHLENPGAMAFLAKYQPNDVGLPYWLIMDGSGSLLADSQIKPGENTGCPTTPDEVAYFISVLEKTSSITPSEDAIIRTRFLNNK
jgi:thiol-disulfide isomerase/thioredoxin